ncbi:autophagy-related protein 18b-like [Zingiber officinale]|uniref:autophagy-related protein 18b-like n=1 Tax=Zingiber officinale TaxID=94328 RepID=UPI001C4C495D|nr:autophagy-related protein 18b-like [Zingiber officinale]
MKSSSVGSPSSSPIICASFNQDNSFFSVGTKDGFKIFDARSGRLCYERAVGAFNIVEMLFSTNLLAIVGAGEQPSLSPRRLCLFNFLTGSTLRELNYLTSVLAVRLNKKRLIVILQDKAYIYDLNSLAVLETIDTVPNNKGLCAFCPGSEGCYLALPASTSKGSVLSYNTVELQSVRQIDAHRSPLAGITFSSTGTYLATASEQGTIIRVHLVSQATESYSVRRGTYPSTIYSLSFGPCLEFPEFLVATSSSGSLHTFSLGQAIKQRRKPSGVIGSLIPDTLSDSFDQTFHHILHNAALAGVKSHVRIYNVDSLTCTSGASGFRASIFIISHNGYFREYTLKITELNEFSWSLEREINLLDNILNEPF